MKSKASTSFVACKRCRDHKIRCDRGFPKCTPCEKGRFTCLDKESWSGRAIPRSYIQDLESKLEQLAAQLHSRSPETAESKLAKSQSPSPAKTATSPSSPSSPDGAVELLATGLTLPTKKEAEEYLEGYFNKSNPQLPVLHREEFIERYFEPFYGAISDGLDLGCTYTKANLKTQAPQSESDNAPVLIEDSNKLSQKRKIGLYFLFQVFAISVTGAMQKYPYGLPEKYHLSAMSNYELAQKSASPSESLQAVLLLGMYSVMRPADPGIWYVVGTAMRMCIEQGIHDEDRLDRYIHYSDTHSQVSALNRDMGRRLFWCTYALDRQICVYLGRPVALSDEYINAKYPSLLDDAHLNPASIANAPVSTGPSYKRVSVAVFILRRIQAQVQHVLYDLAGIPPLYESMQSWKTAVAKNLNQWYTDITQNSTAVNCQFNNWVHSLNYHQTLLLLCGNSPANPEPTTAELSQCLVSGKQVIELYFEIYNAKGINYTWVAVHNLFFGSTSYFYVLRNSAEIRHSTSHGEVQALLDKATSVMSFLRNYTDAAKSCLNTLTNLGESILEQMKTESSSRTLSDLFDMKLYPDDNGNEEQFYNYFNHLSQSLIWEPFLSNEKDPTLPYPP